MSGVLPEFLARTDAQITEERQRQQAVRDLRAKGARQTPEQANLARAIELEPVIRQNLAAIDRSENADAYRDTAIQLAESLAIQGRFAEASAAVKDIADEYFAYYEKQANAAST